MNNNQIDQSTILLHNKYRNETEKNTLDFQQ